MYILRILQDNDIALVKDWLQQDYVSMWFGDVEDWMIEIRGRNADYNFIHHFVVEDSQTCMPIGFVQYYDYSKLPQEDGDIPQPIETYGIGYMIGVRKLLGQGIGKKIVKLISEKVLEDNPKTVRIVADPTIEEAKKNEASIKVLEANAFSFDDISGLYVKNI